ncbi:MAG: RNA 2',3'-cyclic phosphodiesterase [Nanoarchaeota archaeon]|nr:RNA 2',3'-cyclic phosphodiesterase [Nanoarchaeota archaeon]
MNRLFIAIETDEKTRGLLCDLIEKLRRELPTEKFISCDKLHVTILFLGDTQLPVESILDAIKKINFDINITIKGLGAFYFGDFPRVLFAKVTTNLKPIHDEICDALKIKDPRFSPHITLARLKNTKNIDSLVEKYDDFSAEFKAKNLSLFNSDYKNYIKLGPFF